ncbi:MAG: hypothetical protein HGB26_04195 [Desulfobulbaceae bacterium]|nr:hypothetical protein [Desulfobulbaceae bacterium]
MGTVRCVLIVQIAFLFLLAPMAHAEMRSASFVMQTTVIGGGGGAMSSASFSAHETIGQPTPTGQAASAGYRLEAGFWRTLLVIIAGGDVNGDGTIDLLDVILALQIVTGQDVGGVTVQADADGDGRIGIVEAIRALRKLAGLVE